MIKRIFNSQSKTITFAAFLLALSGIISRILALIRDRLLAGKFGAGESLDIYFAAFRIPDFIYGVLIAGGVSAAFLPVFSQYFEKEKKQWTDESLNFINNVLNCFLLLLILICAVLAIFTPQIIAVVIPGFSPENKELTMAMTRIMFLSPVFFGLSSIFSGVLHFFNRFLAYSLAPIFYNLGIIFGILFLVPFFGIFGLAYGVVFGAFLHLLIQIPAAKHLGYKYMPFFNFKFPGILRIFRLMIPRTIGSIANQINLIVITAIASTLAAGSISIFNFSNNLHYFPIAIIGVSFAVSVFPVLSQKWSRGRKDDFIRHFSLAFRQIIFFVVPISFLIFLGRAQIIRIILGTGKFGWWETRLTAASLGIFCLGIIANSLIPLLVRTFFAFHDTKTPVKISIASIFLNISLSLFFIYLFGFNNIFRDYFSKILDLGGVKDIRIVGLPLALSLAAAFQMFLLLFFLYKKIGDFDLEKIIRSFLKIFTGSVIMSFFVYFGLNIFSAIFNLSKFWGLFFQLFFSFSAGILVYLSTILILKSPEIKTIKDSFLSQFYSPSSVEDQLFNQ